MGPKRPRLQRSSENSGSQKDRQYPYDHPTPVLLDLELAEQVSARKLASGIEKLKGPMAQKGLPEPRYQEQHPHVLGQQVVPSAADACW